MKINAPKESYIFIELSGQDMKELNISCDKIDGGSSQTNCIIRTLIDEAGKSLGKKLEIPDGMRVDALPSIDGGCLLFFVAREKPLRYKVTKRLNTLIYWIDKTDSLLDLMGILDERDLAGVSSALYAVNGEILLELKGKIKHSLVMKVNEFLSPERKRSIKKMLTAENRLTGDSILNIKK